MGADIPISAPCFIWLYRRVGMEYYYNLAFDVYFYNDKVGRVVLEGTRLVENRCYLDLEEEKFPHFKYPLIYMKDGRAVRDWLAGRVDFSSFLREVTNRGYGDKPQVRKLRGLIMLYEDIF